MSTQESLIMSSDNDNNNHNSSENKKQQQQSSDASQLYTNEPEIKQERQEEGEGGNHSFFCISNNLSFDEYSRVKSSVIVLALGGICAGYVIGIVAVLLAFYKSTISLSCANAVSEFACHWLAGSDSVCQWNGHRKACMTSGIGQLCLVQRSTTNASVCNNTTQLPTVHDPNVYVNASCHWFVRNGYGLCLDSSAPQNAAAWTSAETGGVAAMMIAGGFVGSFLCRRFVLSVGKIVAALQVVGIISILACSLHIGAWFCTQFEARLALVLCARFVAGIVLGACSIFCTLFNSQNSPPALAPSVGVFFQVFLTIGIALAALVGFLIRFEFDENGNVTNNNNNNNGDKTAAPTTPYQINLNDSVIQRLQWVNAFNILASVSLCFLPCLVRVRVEGDSNCNDYFGNEDSSTRDSRFENPTRQEEITSSTSTSKEEEREKEKLPLTANQQQQKQKVGEKEQEQEGEREEEEEEGDDDEEPSSPTASSVDLWKSFFSRPSLVVAGILLALIQQVSAINVFMNYSPMITKSGLGIDDPLLSNFIVMIWNCVTSFVAIPVASFAKKKGWTSQQIYTAGAFGGACCCLATGLSTHPSIGASDSFREGFGIFAIALFLLCFETSQGPHFYYLTQAIFPDNNEATATTKKKKRLLAQQQHPSLKKTGCVFVNGIHFVFTAGINFGFPVLVEAFGGGGGEGGKKQTEKQKLQGIADAFLLFSGINICSVIVLSCLLPRLIGQKQ